MGCYLSESNNNDRFTRTSTCVAARVDRITLFVRAKRWLDVYDYRVSAFCPSNVKLRAKSPTHVFCPRKGTSSLGDLSFNLLEPTGYVT
jgi:hypothetical protein